MKDRTKARLRKAAGWHVRDDAAPGRERLLDATVVFASRGIANTTVAQIAKAGKVTSAMVHYWFETRERLYDAIVDERLVPKILALWTSADLQRESALEPVQGLLTRMFYLAADAPWLPSLWLREILQVGGLLQERVLQRIPQELTSSFRHKIADAQSRGEINPRMDPSLLFISMLALVMLPQAAARGWHKAHQGTSPGSDQIEAHTSAILMAGLAPTAPDTLHKAPQ